MGALLSVILIGYRGSGKTTVGRALAKRLSHTFVDTDELIMTRAGKNIKEIFEQHGETHFRDLETQVVTELATRENHVISLGGGAILREQNRSVLSTKNATIVYLRAEPEELLRRIRADATTTANRPNLTGLGGGIDEIRSVLASREPIYRQVMTHEVDVTNTSVDDVVQAIAKIMEERKSQP
jgi:shikimate kinase